MSFSAVGDAPRGLVAVSAALLLAIVNLLIRPIVLLLARPLGWIAMLVVGFLVNAVALWITAWLLPGFDVTFLGGILGGIVIAFFNAILTGILEVDEEGSWYQNRIERRAKEQPFDSASEPGRGLMMVEIDGLSYWHLQKALDDGSDAHPAGDDRRGRLSAVAGGLRPALHDLGLPGRHHVWRQPRHPRLSLVRQGASRSCTSPRRMPTELNARYAHGQGLMRHGSSIMNMLNGDAEKSMFTMANMFDAATTRRRSAAPRMWRC